MVEMTRGLELHGRACRGDRLSAEERLVLDSWYAEMDSDEAKTLGPDLAESPTNEDLRAEIRDRLVDLQATLEKIRDVEEGNAVLRQQNDELKRKLVEKGILAA